MREPEYDSALDALDKAWQISFLDNAEDEKLETFDHIKKICDEMGQPERKKQYISRMKPPTRKTDTRNASTARTAH